MGLRQTKRHSDRQTDIQRHRHRQGLTGIHRDRETEINRDRETRLIEISNMYYIHNLICIIYIMK